MNEMKLIVYCPLCGNDMERNIMIADNTEIHAMDFEQNNWRCHSCEKTFSSGELEPRDIDEL